MSFLLQQYSLPADRMVGCTFATAFESQAIIELGGATIYGSPTFDRGLITLDGTTDYVKFALDGHEFYSDNLTIEQEFWPDFEYDEDGKKYFFNTGPGGKEYLLFKHDNARNNVLRLYLGATTMIGDIPSATYSPHWKVNERNVIQISSDGTTINVYLNNNLIFSGGNAWTKTAPTYFVIGASRAGGDKFRGKIGPVKIYQSVLHERDHYNTYYNCAYGFTNDAVAYWGMRDQDHDAANNRTLDVSGNNNHAVFGAGGATPTKGTKRGYNFDGGDYMIAPATGIFNRPEVGIAVEFTPYFLTDENAEHYLFDTTSGSRYLALKRNNAQANVLLVFLGNGTIFNIPEATYKPYWRQGERNVLAISGKSGATDVHLNEGLVLNANGTIWTAKDPANFYLGSQSGLISNFLGDIHSMMIFPYLLTPRMVSDLRWNRIGSIGEE